MEEGKERDWPTEEDAYGRPLSLSKCADRKNDKIFFWFLIVKIQSKLGGFITFVDKGRGTVVKSTDPLSCGQ